MDDVVNGRDVAQHSSGNAAHEWAMTFDQRGEGFLIASLDEAREQRRVRLGNRLRGQALNQVGDLRDGNGRHGAPRYGVIEAVSS